MYSIHNYKSKKELRAAVAVGPVPCYQPGPFGPDVKDGSHCCEGPHYPEAHRWYATVIVANGNIIKVKS